MKNNKKIKSDYIKPDIVKVKKMTFMFDVYKNIEQACRQCSSCHGCR